MQESLAEKFVFICSPYRPESSESWAQTAELAENIRIAKLACCKALNAGYVPMASHLHFTQFLDDEKEEERNIGIRMGLAWLEKCDEMWVIGDRISKGMAVEIARAAELCIPIKIKSLAELEAMA